MHQFVHFVIKTMIDKYLTMNTTWETCGCIIGIFWSKKLNYNIMNTFQYDLITKPQNMYILKRMNIHQW
jgi:hypothetical protein